jgi:hypothetical protein
MNPSDMQAILKELYKEEQMKKVCVREWVKLHYGKKSISIKTIQRKCRNGQIPNAIKEGNKWFILMSAKEYEQRRK